MSRESSDLDRYAQPYLDMGYGPVEAYDMGRADLLYTMRPEGNEPPTGPTQETSEHVVHRHSTAPGPDETLVIRLGPER